MGVRRFAEHLSRGVVLRRRLPSKFGRLPVYVTPEAGLRYWSAMSRVDPILYSMAEELVKPRSVVWDVGANVGLFSFCAAALSGRSGFVLAVEPDLWLARLIARSSQELDPDQFMCSDVKVLCASVSDSGRISQLEVAERARASNHLVETLGSTQAKGQRYLQLTVSLTLDFLLEYFPAPSVLKIDVETHEISVLKGAARLLKEVRPTIWCEVSHENSQEVTSLLHAAGYVLYGAETRPHPRTDRAWFHTLAIPAPSCAC
jgi:FkbM family methyltransferase